MEYRYIPYFTFKDFSNFCVQILVSLAVKDKDQAFELHEGTHSIGRTSDNKVVLSYASISKKHALLGKLNTTWYPIPDALLEVSKSSNNKVYCFITDCDSLNKTRLCRSGDEKGIVLTPNTRYEVPSRQYQLHTNSCRYCLTPN